MGGNIELGKLDVEILIMQQTTEPQKSKMAALLEQAGWDVNSFAYGDIVEGTVVAKGKNELLVDIGGKSEGIISGKELTDSYQTFKKAQVGDKLLTFVVHAEDEQGYVVLSLGRAESERRWLELSQAQQAETPLTVEVLDFNKGGLLVALGNIRGFIPVSHVDRAHFPDATTRAALGSRVGRDNALAELVGQELQARVIELDRKSNRLILSEKLATTGKTSDEQKKLLQKLAVGDVVKGKVTSILPFGIFVDLNGFEGLVHISELSWGKVSDPGELFEPGQEIEVKVTEIDLEDNKVSLSVKDLQEDPWRDSDCRYKVGTTVEGVVTKVTPYGAFIRLEEGMDGLIHISETKGPLTEGETIKTKIISFDPTERKLGLSIKQLA